MLGSFLITLREDVEAVQILKCQKKRFWRC